MITSTFVPDSIHAGDCGPFGESLYNTISKNISRLAGKFYSILTIEDVQDLTHDTYLRLLESKSNADMSKNFAGYVYRTCKNQVNTYAANKSKRNGLRHDITVGRGACKSGFKHNIHDNGKQGLSHKRDNR